MRSPQVHAGNSRAALRAIPNAVAGSVERFWSETPTPTKTTITPPKETVVPRAAVKPKTPATPQVTTTIALVTPADAEAWLTGNTHNRSLRQSRVDFLSGVIERGEWMLNGDAIRFATDGTVLDGQHRLWAIALGSTPVESVIVRGLPKPTQETMDQVAKRSLSDALKLRGVLNATHVSSAVVYHWRYAEGFLRNPSRRPSTAQAIAHLEANPGILAAMSVAVAAAKRLRVSRSVVATCYFEFSTLDEGDADDFFDSLIHGANMSTGSPILALRTYLETHAAAGARSQAVVHHALIIKAWNYWRDGQEISRLGWRASGANAEPFPVPR